MAIRLALTILVLCLGSVAQALSLQPGDIVVLNRNPVGGQANILIVDPDTGTRTYVSGQSRGAGPELKQMADVAISPTGEIFVLARDASNDGWILRVDPLTGDRTVVADSSTGTGRGIGGQDLRYDAGRLLYSVSSQSGGGIVSVDLATGNRTDLAGFGTIGTGPTIDRIRGLALDASGLAITLDRDPFGDAQVLTVDLTSGNRSVLSNGTTGTGDPLLRVSQVHVGDDGTIYVTPSGNPVSALAVAVDPVTGNRTVVGAVSDPGVSISAAGGQSAWDPFVGGLLMTGRTPDAGGDTVIYRIDLLTGTRTAVAVGAAQAGTPLGPLDGLIVYTGTAIPEPGRAMLVGLVVAGFMIRRGRTHRR